VKITCKCGTKKEKWECAKAQLERKNRKLAARVDSLLECNENCPKEPIIPVKEEKPQKEITVKNNEDSKKKKKEKKSKVNEKEEKEEAQKKQKQVVTKMAKLQKKPFPYEYLLYAVIAAIVMAFGVYVYLEPVKQIQKIK
jgi:preprotein translocase subunit Sss1